MIALNRAELRSLYALCIRHRPPGGRPLDASELVALEALLDKLREMIAAHVDVVERGHKVLEWRVPAAIAPSMNSWGAMKTWQRARARTELGDRLRPLIAATPGADLCGSTRMRIVRCTRFTLQPKLVDEAAADSIGGKMPIDALVRMGVLAGDDARALRRQAFVLPTKRGNAHLLVEVFEVAVEEVPDPGPKDGIVDQITRTRGKFTRAIIDGEKA